MLARVIHLRRRSSEQGLTLIECLVAIVVIAVVGVAIAPTILLAAATRVQNQKVEQAIQLSQGEVNRIRLLTSQGDYTTADLPKLSSQADIRNTSAPASGSNGYTTNRANMTETKGLAFDVNQDGTPDFIVQTFRDAGVQDNTIPIVFNMGVRVYDYIAFAENQTLQPQQLSLGFTSGQNLQRPLSVLYTVQARSDRPGSLDQYRQQLTN